MKVGVSLPDELLAFADAEATRRGTTRSGLLARLLKEAQVREQTRRYLDQHGHIDAASLICELEMIADRCPVPAFMDQVRGEYQRAVDIVTVEINELYQQVEKMRELQAAVASDMPPVLPTS